MSLTFVREFLRSPSSVGALWPSSPSLAKTMVRAAGVAGASHVLELGPGTGAITEHILPALQTGARFLAVEKSPALVNSTAEKFPSARIIEGCATQLEVHLAEEDFPRPDAVISGLPWAAFPQELQREILGQISRVLQEGAIFTTFAYFGPHRLPTGAAFRKRLEGVFSSVTRTPIVFDNVPPAFVYVCKR